jgi:coenzyme F420-reducing hydrogenase beta subunit
MKSARFVESFAWQMNVPVHEIARVEFRYKDPDRPANWYNVRLTLRDGSIASKDWWHLADGDWGAGFFQNSACDYCDDVVAETADISFGDAWVEPFSSDGRGTNVVVVRSPEVGSIVDQAIADGRLHLENVNAELVVETQAAGFRQRREGLAYRLTLQRSGLLPTKRVMPDNITLDRRRKVIYRMRRSISRWSHKLFMIARLLHLPQVYISWARAVASVYHGVAYSTGRINQIANWLGFRSEIQR